MRPDLLETHFFEIAGPKNICFDTSHDKLRDFDLASEAATRGQPRRPEVLKNFIPLPFILFLICNHSLEPIECRYAK